MSKQIIFILHSDLLTFIWYMKGSKPLPDSRREGSAWADSWEGSSPYTTTKFRRKCSGSLHFLVVVQLSEGGMRYRNLLPLVSAEVSSNMYVGVTLMNDDSKTGLERVHC